jgi:hypothetical protein
MCHWQDGFLPRRGNPQEINWGVGTKAKTGSLNAGDCNGQEPSQ